MSHKRCHNIILVLPVLFLISAMYVQPTAGTEADEIQETVVETIEVRQETQKKEDAWAGTKTELTARYRSLKANQDHLKKLKLKTEKALAAQKARLSEYERRIKERARIKEELEYYLESVVANLEEFIKKDLPFLSEERSARLSSIKETLERPDKPVTEKYRRVMEAIQVETEYGRTVEVYQDTVDLDGQSVLADILRLGRLSLFCRTPDGTKTGRYDQAAQGWEVLPSAYCREIGKAVEMARRERTIDIVRMPIGRIVP
ncbi:MAG: hypothetical protein BA865_06060 [Desulfobacterales bacterium S5133MH4]|nr:MAG: hypothetical protein BA865_06060 [Desulfobacterales bacterium S5133MH4]